jgi:hypothetical protein
MEIHPHLAVAAGVHFCFVLALPMQASSNFLCPVAVPSLHCTCDDGLFGQLLREALLLGTFEVKVEAKDGGEDAKEHQQADAPSGYVDCHPVKNLRGCLVVVGCVCLLRLCVIADWMRGG